MSGQADPVRRVSIIGRDAGRDPEEWFRACALTLALAVRDECDSASPTDDFRTDWTITLPTSDLNALREDAEDVLKAMGVSDVD